MGIGGYMGSEHLVVEAHPTAQSRATTMRSPTRRSNCSFENLNTAISQRSSGSFYVYQSTLRNIRQRASDLYSSATNTFLFGGIVFDSPSATLIDVGHSGAAINVLADRIQMVTPSGTTGSFGYAAGGSVVIFGSNLGGRVGGIGGSLATPIAIFDTATSQTGTVTSSGNGLSFQVMR